eukprot:CAMPEP_0184348994 /NCGR_PEP_ID=MMETSP1089-20130417/32093_1 /TAXON_ID=38269 ORGANISM="Gloeochaete wittrockiana, Strain SAG46.84" /NCGR_SAMPLE_ID=MMETSP1089 /ASSEMBLY_ACC=CAM_ASM_000445 /LENGTH=163 /DNA_ID=CAMNT_0026681015 /DNA_START=41 /DNA_END=532 /DNA_ORIENTATION=-
MADKEQCVMDVRVEEREPVRVAFLRHIGPYDKTLEPFWRNKFLPFVEANNLKGRDRFAILHDVPCTTVPEKNRYDAACEVSADFVASGEAQITTIPGGKYAVLHFLAPLNEIAAAWPYLLKWLPSNGFRRTPEPPFEFYPKNGIYVPETEVMEVQLCIPVVPL